MYLKITFSYENGTMLCTKTAKTIAKLKELINSYRFQSHVILVALCPGWMGKRKCVKPVGHFILTYKSPLASYTCWDMFGRLYRTPRPVLCRNGVRNSIRTPADNARDYPLRLPLQRTRDTRYRDKRWRFSENKNPVSVYNRNFSKTVIPKRRFGESYAWSMKSYIERFWRLTYTFE